MPEHTVAKHHGAAVWIAVSGAAEPSVGVTVKANSATSAARSATVWSVSWSVCSGMYRPDLQGPGSTDATTRTSGFALSPHADPPVPYVSCWSTRSRSGSGAAYWSTANFVDLMDRRRLPGSLKTDDEDNTGDKARPYTPTSDVGALP